MTSGTRPGTEADSWSVGHEGWSAGHEGIDPTQVRFLRGWLTGVDIVAAPLVRARVHPDVITVAGVLASVAVPALTRAGRPAAAVPALLASVCLDGLDGAVARGTGRVSGHGRVLDSTCDRIAELAWWSALAATGVPAPALSVIAALTLGMEGWRAHSGSYGTLTVWERPSRTILTALGLAGTAALARGRVPSHLSGIRVVDITAAVGLALSAAGAAHLGLRAARDPST